MQISSLRKVKPSLRFKFLISCKCAHGLPHTTVSIWMCVCMLIYRLQWLATHSIIVYAHIHHPINHTTHYRLIINWSQRPTSSPSSCPNYTVNHNRNNQNNKLHNYIISDNLDCINFCIKYWFMWFVVVCNHNNVQLN